MASRVRLLALLVLVLGLAPTSSATAVDDLALAVDLLTWGRANENPGAIALAATMLADGPLDGTPSRRLVGEPPEDGPALAELAPVELLEEAEALARRLGDRALARRIARIDLPGGRGTTHAGFLFCKAAIGAGVTQVYRVEFEARVPARLVLSNTGGEPLSIAVHDLEGERVAGDPDQAVDRSLQWTPEFTTPVLIEVRNLGDTAGEYVLLSN
jgi:hypothetical protein